jgi:hypothetical protein
VRLPARACRRQKGRYAQTAPRFKEPLGCVTIRNPIHPLHGHTLAIRNIRRVGDLVEVIVAHPDGGVLTLPAWATDLTPPRPPCPVGKTLPLFAPAQLLTLLHRIATLTATTASAPAQSLDSATAPAPNLPPVSEIPAAQVGQPIAPSWEDHATKSRNAPTSLQETPDVEPPRTTHRSRARPHRPDGPAHSPHRSVGRPHAPPDPRGPPPTAEVEHEQDSARCSTSRR